MVSEVGVVLDAVQELGAREQRLHHQPHRLALVVTLRLRCREDLGVGIVTSSVVSGRRKMRVPVVPRMLETHAASVVVQVTILASAAGLAQTSLVIASAASK